MKKKLITLLLATAFVLSLAACGGKETTSPTDTDSTSDSSETPTADTGNNESQEEETEKKENTSSVDLPIVYNVPRKDIYMNAPAFQEIEETFTELFIVHEEKYVAFTAARLSTATDAEDAHAKAFEEFILNMRNYEESVNSINISESETKTVNGMEVYRFEGMINYGRSTPHDAYAVGYSFIMDDIPCQIIGSVISEDQEEETKQEIEEIVDAMIETVRSEP